MLEPRWSYSNGRTLTQRYGHVGYYGRYIIGQWFSLDAETGVEHWSRSFWRPDTVSDYANDVIIAAETRSDGPWTLDMGIYGIDAGTGDLLWTSHGRGLWGKFLRGCDFVPLYTNEFRDSPRHIVNGHLLTRRGRTLDVRNGRDCNSTNLAQISGAKEE